MHGTLYAANAGSNSISSFRVRAGKVSLTDATAASTSGGGPVDLAASRGGQYLYQLNGADGSVDTFRVGRHGALTRIETTRTGLGATNGRPLEGIAAS